MGSVSKTMSEVWSKLVRTVTGLDELLQFVRGRLDDSKAKMQAAPVIGEKEIKTPLIQRMIQQRVSGTSDDTLVQRIVSECMGHL